MPFKHIIDNILAIEGGYTWNVKDLGGETNWGITKATADRFGYKGKMKDLTKQQAGKMYEKMYIISPGFDQITFISSPIGIELIDTGVNMGRKRAGRFLQQSLNSFNRQQKLYKDLVVDGQCGANTRDALKSYISHRGHEGVETLLKALNCLQGARYIELGEVREANEEFTYGWITNRVALP